MREFQRLTTDQFSSKLKSDAFKFHFGVQSLPLFKQTVSITNLKRKVVNEIIFEKSG